MGKPILSWPVASGIYKITCSGNNRCYVGSAQNLRERLGVHFAALRRGNHKNPHIQAAWNKYGADTFTSEVLEFCEIDVLYAREQYYIDTLQAAETGFNIVKFVLQPMRGLTVSAETKEKLRVAHTGKIYSPETLERMRAAQKARGKETSAAMRAHWATGARESVINKIADSNRGQKRSPEVLDKFRQVSTDLWATPEHREKMLAARAAAPRWTQSDEMKEAARLRGLKRYEDPAEREKTRILHTGRKNTEETKAKMRAAALARYADPEKRAKFDEGQKKRDRSVTPETREKMRQSALAYQEKKRLAQLP